LGNPRGADRKHQQLLVIAGQPMDANKALIERRIGPARQRRQARWTTADQVAEKDQPRRPLVRERGEFREQPRELAVAAVHVPDREDRLIEAQRRSAPLGSFEIRLRVHAADPMLSAA
jgi:hypothetical protein